MNKKSMVKLGVAGGILLLLLVFIFIALATVSSSNAVILREKYEIGDKVKIDLRGYGVYRLKLVSPTKTYSKIGFNNVLLYKTKDLGNHTIIIKSNKEQGEFYFTVTSINEAIEQNNSNIIGDENRVNLTLNESGIENKNITNNSENEIDILSVEGEVAIGKTVKWKRRTNIGRNNRTKKINLPKSFNVTVYNKEPNSRFEFSNYFIEDYNDSISIVIDDLYGEISNEVEIEYYTDPPVIEEKIVNTFKKEVKISSPEGLDYENVKSFTNIPEIIRDKELIEIYWKEEDRFLDFEAIDTDGNGLLDYVEWIVPHLSEQNFEIIIITKAEHLDANRNFIEDIFNMVKELDGIWSPTIPAGDYIRVTFEQLLTSKNDITIYPRIISGDPRIEIYEKDGNDIVAEFTEIIEDQYNKVFLTGLNGSQDTFDLLVLGGSVIIEHIIDPFPPYDNALIVQIYQSSVTQDLDTEQSIQFNNETYVHSNFSHSTSTNNERLTFNEDGLYKVSYGCGFVQLGVGGGRRMIMGAWLENASGIEINPSRTFCYLRDTEDDRDRCSVAATTLVNMSAGDNLTLQVNLIQGFPENADTDESCWIYAERVNRHVAQIYETTHYDDQLSTGTHITQDFDAITYEDSDFFSTDLTNNWITVLQNGWYKIYYSVSSQQVSGAADTDRSTVASYLYLNDTTEIIPSRTFSYHKRTDQAGYSTEEGFVMVNLNAYENVSVRRFLMQQEAGSAITNTTNNSWLLIERIEDDNLLFLWDSAGGQTSTPAVGSEGVPINITWDTQGQIGSNFSHGSGDSNFTIDENGWFEISYAVSWDKLAGADRRIVCARLLSNDILIEPSEQCDYTRDSGSTTTINSVAGNFIVNNTEGTQYLLQYATTGIIGDETNVLEPNSSWITVMPVKLFDFIIPNVTINFPQNTNYNGSDLPLNFNVTLSELGSFVFYTLDNGITNVTMGSLDNLTFNDTNGSLAEGTYMFRVYANDTAGNRNDTENVSFLLDIYNPNVTIDLPENVSYNFNASIPLNFTASDTHLDSCWYNIDNGANISLSGCSDSTFNTSEGLHILNLFANDTTGKVNSSESVSFLADVTFPLISFGVGTENNNTNISRNWIYVNVTITEANFANVTFRLFNSTQGIVNETIFNDSTRTINWTNLPNDRYYYNVSVSDSATNINTTDTRNLALDTVGPNITIDLPEDGKYYGYNSSLALNVSVFDELLEVDSCWWNLDNGINNSIICNQNITFNTSIGSHTVHYYSNDSANAIGYSNSSFSIDIIYPLIEFGDGTESNNTNFTRNWIFVNVTINETNFANVTFGLFNSTNGVVNITTHSSVVNTINWTGLVEGEYYYNVSVFDLADNYNATTTRGISIDPTPPEIILNTPANNSVVGSSENLTANISDGFSLSNATLIIYNSSNDFIAETTINITGTFAETGIVYSFPYDDVFLWSYMAEDGSGNSNYSFNRTITADTNVPVVEFGVGTEVNDENVSRNWIYVNVSVIELSEENITFVLFNSTDEVNTTTFSTPVRTINWTGLPDGKYSYNVSVYDIFTNFGTSGTRNITIDTTNPNGTLINPGNNSFENNVTQNLTVNVSDNIGLKNATLFVYNSSDDLVNQTNTDLSGTKYLLGIVYEFLYDGVFNWFYRITDIAGNTFYTVNNTITIDTANSGIIIFEPQNTSYNNNSLEINFSYSDLNIDTCWYTNNSGANNYTLSNCDNITYTAEQGSTTIRLYANDSANNLNDSEEVTFFVDSIFPLINYGDGMELNGSNATRDWIFVNVSVTEINEANITFRLFNSAHIAINTTTYSTPVRSVNWTNIADGLYYFNVTVSDILTNINFTETYTITLDDTGPVINIVEPQDGKTYTFNTSLVLNVTVSDVFSEVDSCWWNFDNEANTSITCNTNTTFNKTDGTYTLFYYSNDSLGNIAVSNSTFRVFTAGPAVNLVSPEDNSYFNVTGLFYLNYSALGPLGISSCNLYADFGDGWHLNQTQKLNWWNESWQFREKLNVTALSNVTTNYTVDIALDTTGGRFLDNGDDVRVVFYNGSDHLELDRLIVRPNETDSQVQFRLQRPIIANQSDADYAFYYGYENATNPPDNASIVWFFYDDFSSGSLFQWTYGSGTFFVNTSVTNPWTNTSNVLELGACDTSFLKVNSTYFPPVRDLKLRALWMDNPESSCGGGSPDADGILGLRGSESASYDGILVERDTDTGFHYDIGATGSVPGDFSPFDVWYWVENHAYGTNETGHRAKHWNFTDLEPDTYQLEATAVAWTTPGLPFLRVASGRAHIAVVFGSELVANEPTVTVQEEEWIGAFNVTLVDDIHVPWNVICFDRNGAGAFAVNNYTFTIDTTNPLISFAPENVTDNTEDLFAFSGTPVSPSNSSDENFTTFSILDSDPDIDIVYMNYTSSGNSATLEYLADWNIGAGGIDCYNTTDWEKFVTMADNVTTNATIPSECLNTDTFEIRVYRSLSSSLGFVNFYEEQVHWNTIVAPQDYTNTSSDSLFVTVEAEEENEANITYSLFNSTGSYNTSIFTNKLRRINWTNIPDGTYTYNVTIVDYVLKVNSTETRTITIDTVNPNGTLLSPLNLSYQNNVTQNMTVNATDNNELDNVTLFVYNNSNDLINQTSFEAVGTQAIIGIIYEFLYDGIFNWFYRITDIAGNTFDTTNYTITIDTTNPTINFTDPTEDNNTEFERKWIFVNVTFNDTNFANVTYVLFNETGSELANTSIYSSQQTTINWTGLASGNITYLYNVTVTDLANNINSTLTRTITLIDTQNPDLILDNPKNITYFTNVSLDLDFIVSDDNLESCWFNLNGGSNITIANCQNTTFNTSEGNINLTIYVNDSLGFMNSSSVLFVSNSSLVETSDWLVVRGFESNVDGEDNVEVSPVVDIRKSFVMHTTRDSDSGPDTLQVTTTLTASNNLRLENYVSGSGVQVEWEIITGPGLDVQRGTISYVSGESIINATINEVNLSRSFIVVSNRLNDFNSANNERGYFRGRFANETYLEFERSATGSAGVLDWQVVEWNESDVQSGNFSTNETSVIAALNNSVNPNRTILIFSRSVSSGGGEETSIGGYLVNSTTLAFYRNSTDGGLMEGDWFVIEYEKFDVQRGFYTHPTSSTDPENVPLNLDLIQLNKSFHKTYWDTEDGTGNTFSRAYMTSKILNLTDLEFQMDDDNFDQNATWQVVEIKDLVAPVVNLIIPINYENLSTSTVSFFNYTVTDESNMANCSLYGDWSGGWHLNRTDTGSPTGNRNFSDVILPNDGTFLWNVVCTDIYNNVGTANSNFTFSIDSTFPLIDFGTGTLANDSNVTNDFVYVNVTVTEINEANITFRLYNSSVDLINESFFSTSQRTINWTNLSNGVYYYNVSVSDTFNNINFTETRTITLDDENPNATLISPINESYQNNATLNLTVNATDNLGLKNTTFFIYNSTDDLVNQTTTDISGTEYLLGVVYEFLYDGIFNWFYRITDIAGNTFDTTNFTVTIDTTFSLIQFENPTENSGFNFTRDWIFVNVSVNETNEANITFTLYNSTGSVNISTYTTQVRTTNWTGLIDGTYFYNVSIYDLASNQNFTETRNISLDTTGPSIIILNPVTGSLLGFNTSINLNASVTDNVIGSDTCWWSIDGGINQTITCGSNATFNTSDGEHTIYFYANDTLGNLDFNTTTFTVSTLGPAINLNFPENNSYLNYTQDIIFNYTTLDPQGVDTCRLYGNWSGGWHINQTDIAIENGTTNYFSVNVTDGEEQFYWNVWCNDTLGLESFAASNFTFTIDTIFPLIDYGFGTPVDNTNISSNSIFVNVTVTEINEANITFRLFNTTQLVSNVTFSNQTRHYNWTNLAQTDYFFQVIVTDFANQINSTTTRTVTLDTTAPIINLEFPSSYQNFSTYVISQFNYTSSDDVSIDNCTLHGNWTGSFELNQTVSNPNNNGSIVQNFSSINSGSDGFYIWNVRCVDNAGNIGWNLTNFSFSTFLFPEELNKTFFNISQDENDGTGNITLFWNFSNHSQFYRIYYNESLSGEFVFLNETFELNYTDTTFSSNKRRFYRVDAANPTNQNNSTTYFGSHVYTLEHNQKTQNWIGFPTNFSYLINANRTLYEIINATAITLWNATNQRRVTCNSFSCPSTVDCTDTNCNFDIEQERGYEVNLNSSAPSIVNWSGVGITYDPLTINLTKNSTDFGKNWISVYANSSMISAWEILTNISSADSVSQWLGSSQTSQGIIHSPFPWAAYLGTNFTLEIEKGYEVSVNVSINWTQN